MSSAPVKAAPKKKTGAFERGLSPMQEVTAFVTNPYKFTSQLIVSAKGPIPDCVTFSHSLWGITLWRQGQAGNKASWLHSFVGAFFCNVGGGASLANLASHSAYRLWPPGSCSQIWQRPANLQYFLNRVRR